MKETATKTKIIHKRENKFTQKKDEIKKERKKKKRRLMKHETRHRQDTEIV